MNLGVNLASVHATGVTLEGTQSAVLPMNVIAMLHWLLFALALGAPANAWAYDCPNGAYVEGADQIELDLRCNAFKQYKKPGEMNVDPAIEAMIPPRPPTNRPIRSFALVVAIYKYDNFGELTAVKNEACLSG